MRNAFVFLHKVCVKFIYINVSLSVSFRRKASADAAVKRKSVAAADDEAAAGDDVSAEKKAKLASMAEEESVKEDAVPESETAEVVA